MRRLITRPLHYLFVILSGFALVPLSHAANHYDVSYLWSSDVDGVRDYREQVGKVLGPQMAKQLTVVANGDLYGLVYRRRGDNHGARTVARNHSDLLKARGLEAAAVIPSRSWKTIDGDAAASPGRVISRSERASELRNLEAAVEDYIRQLRHQGKLAADERTGWSVYDFTTGEKLVDINEDVQFQAASLVKPFIAAAFFQRVEDGELKYGSKSRRHMERMIQHSDNASTNWVTRQVGGPRAVERILKQHYPGIFQDTRLVEYIPAGGRTYRNKASAHDYSRFLYAVWKDEIAGAREIKRLMALPGSDRIYSGAKAVPKGAQVYNKTGSTARLCGDMGILNIKGRDGKRYPYTVIGIIEKQQSASNYTAWIRSRGDVIRNVSNIVYQGIAAHHGI